MKEGNHLPEVLLLCGEVASGKTTFAKHYVEKHPNTVILSVDECMYEVMRECQGRAERVMLEGNILRYFYSLSIQLLQQGCHVMIDHGYWLKQERAEAGTFYQSRHIQAILCYLTVDDETQRQRLAYRNERINEVKQNIITEEMRVRFHQFFQEPEEEECQLHQLRFLKDPTIEC